MANWPFPVQNRFDHVPLNPRENDFFAPYNKLLSTLFPVDTEFTVGPQSYPLPESIDFLVEYTITYEEKPVLILEVTAPGKIGLKSAREEADVQIRRRMLDLLPSCPLPTLHAISAFGTVLSFYSAQKGDPPQIDPIAIDPSPLYVTDTAPRGRWDCDVLEDVGATRLRNVVQEIKAGCAQL